MIVARSFGKCPSCYRDLPDELQLSESEKEMKKIDERSQPKNDWLLGDGSTSLDGLL